MGTMDDRRELTDKVKQAALDQGFELVGVCDAKPPASLGVFDEWTKQGFHGSMGYLPRSRELRKDVSTLLPGVRSILAVGLFYGQPNPVVPGRPHIAAYALGRDYHKVLRSKLKRVVARVTEWRPESRCRIAVDSAPVLEREYASRAGLGWFGKNTCLIDSVRGSKFVIGLLLTTLDLDADEPSRGGCGTCTACIDACPTGAIVPRDGGWQVDARSCISYLTIEHRGPFEDDQGNRTGAWTFGCDVCQTVCPFNTPRPGQPLRAPVTTCPDFLAVREWPDLERLTVLTEEEWDTLTRGSPVRRAGREGLARNARANLAYLASDGREPSTDDLTERGDEGLDVLRKGL